MAQQVVLLVDDDDDVRDTIGDLLEADRFRVLRAADAAQALMMMRDEAIDVLLTDLSMPGADGVTLIQQARKIMPELPAILLTGYAEQVSSVAMSAGGFHVLRKPVTADYLTGQIRSLLERPIEPGK